MVKNIKLTLFSSLFSFYQFLSAFFVAFQRLNHFTLVISIIDLTFL